MTAVKALSNLSTKIEVIEAGDSQNKPEIAKSFGFTSSASVCPYVHVSQMAILLKDIVNQLIIMHDQDHELWKLRCCVLRKQNI